MPRSEAKGNHQLQEPLLPPLADFAHAIRGEDVVESVTKAHPGLPVVLITGQGDIKSAVNAIKLGAFDYVLKPPDETELQLTVERALYFLIFVVAAGA